MNGGGDDDRGGESKPAVDAVEAFLRDVESVYDEYDRGYLDADAALRRVRTHLDELASTVEDD